MDVRFSKPVGFDECCDGFGVDNLSDIGMEVVLVTSTSWVARNFAPFFSSLNSAHGWSLFSWTSHNFSCSMKLGGFGVVERGMGMNMGALESNLIMRGKGVLELRRYG